jgi:hypothetical protein
MLPRTDEDFDAALDEFDRIFRRIPPQRGLITTGPWSLPNQSLKSVCSSAALANDEQVVK